MLMSRIRGGSGKSSFLGAWDIAATLGLVAVAVIVERTASADDAKPALPPKEGRHASTAGLGAGADPFVVLDARVEQFDG